MKLSKKLVDRLTDFQINNIESKALDGITYVMAFKSDTKLINKCKEILEETKSIGCKENEIFRAYELPNGYIFDMDLAISKFIVKKLAEAVAKEQQLDVGDGDIIGNRPEKRRREDMEKLAKYCVEQFKKGETHLEVALFSRNSVPKIMISGTEKGTNKKIMASYRAFAIRHWDIEAVNNQLLATKGIRISRIKPCEILPSKTGVRFEITLQRI